VSSLRAFALAFLALCATVASAQDFQRDVQVGANLAAFADTIRTMQARGYFDQKAAEAYLPNYTRQLSSYLGRYEGQQDRFQEAVRQAARPHRDALRAIYAASGQGRAPAGFRAPLPTPESVLSSIEGTSTLDTASRQVAAFKILRDAIEDLSGRMDIMAQPPELAAYQRLYLIAEIHAQARMQPTFDPNCQGMECPRARFVNEATRYQFDAGFQREFLGKHWPQNVVAAYVDMQARLRAEFDARQKAEQEDAKRREQIYAPGPTKTFWRKLTDGLGVVLMTVVGIGGLIGFFALLVWSGLLKSTKTQPPPLTDNYGKADFEGLRKTLPRPDAFQPHGNPLFLQPIDYWNLQEAFAHMKASDPKMYWNPPLMFDPNPYAPGQDQRERASPPPARNGMTEAEAREILEVGPNATRAEIMAAYKRLMAKVHPDRGGSNFFAKQLNAARAVLLGDEAAV
jgi:hypothetical protein